MLYQNVKFYFKSFTQLKLIKSPENCFLLLWNNECEFFEQIVAYLNGGQWAPSAKFTPWLKPLVTPLLVSAVRCEAMFGT